MCIMYTYGYHNPWGVYEWRDIMKYAYVDQNICDRSPFCPASHGCKFGAFNVERSGFFKVKISVNKEKCTGCGVCTKYCPHDAIKLKNK